MNGKGKVNELECTVGDTFFIPAHQKASLQGAFDYIYITLEKE